MGWTLAIAALANAASGQGLPNQKVLTLEVAEAIAHEAMLKCRSDGYRVSVTVVDGTNHLKAFVRDDGAAMGTVEVGRMKANSVMAFGLASGPPASLAAGGAAAPPILPGTVNLPGGLPIKSQNDLIGAVSVSGAPGGDKDAACAQAGLIKVADRLK